MGFIDGFKNVGGLCPANNMFYGLVNWTEYGGQPIPAGQIYRSGYTGDLATQANIGGLEFEYTGLSGNFDIYILDVTGTDTKEQIVLKGWKNPQFPNELYYKLAKRVYDATGETYTDTDFQNSNCQIQIFSNDPGWAAYRTISTYGIFTTITYEGVQYLIAGCSESIQIDGVGVRAAWQCYMLPWASFKSMINGEMPMENFSPEFGPAEEPEGYSGGSFDFSSDEIDMPTKPQSILNLGFINVYKCDANALTDFGAALFPEITWPSSLADVGEVLASFAESVWNSKLIDYVISVHCIPGDVPAGTPVDIRIGARNMLGIEGRRITNEYVDFDFGSLDTSGIYRNFMDSMCQAELWLPFYGFISLKPEHWNGGVISVKYRFNVIDGSFMAYVFSKPSKSEMTKPGLIGQYGGSAVVHLPVSSMSYASMFSGMIGGTAQAAGGLASGNISTAISGAATALSSASGGDAKMSNSYNASSSFMTRRKPFLLISAPVPAFSTRYAVENGLPSNSVYTLGQCLGFTQAENAILDGIPCTADEKKRLEEYLKTGIIIKATPNE